MNNKEQPNYYAILTANVRYDKRLSPNAKLLYAEITALSNKDGKCWATNKYFADLYNLDTRSITRIISKLVEIGYIKLEIVYKENTKEILRRDIILQSAPIDKNINTPIDKNINTPIDKNVEDNNTRINITRENKEKYKKESNKQPEQKNKRDTLFDLLLKENPNLEEKEKEYAKKFLEYRKIINKPIKTILPIKAYLKALDDLEALGYSKDEAISTMKENEWQTIKVDYIHKPKKINNGYKSKSERNNEMIDLAFKWQEDLKKQLEINNQENEEYIYLEDIK